jgi:hypothetical protein
MSSCHTEKQASDESLASLYARCLEEIRQRLEPAVTLTAETLQVAASAVQESLTKAGNIRQDDLQRIIDTIVTNWQQALAHHVQEPQEIRPSPTVQALTEQGMALLAHLAGAVKTFAGEVESRLQRELEYHTGTVVEAGNFFCTQCDKEIQTVKIGPLPPCSRCHGTAFRRYR